MRHSEDNLIPPLFSEPVDILQRISSSKHIKLSCESTVTEYYGRIQEVTGGYRVIRKNTGDFRVLREDTGGYGVIREDPAKPTAGWIRVWLTFSRVAIWQVESIQLLHLSESSLTRDLEPTTFCEVSLTPVCKEYIVWRILSLPLKRLWKWVMISLLGKCLWQDSKGGESASYLSA